MLVYLYDKHITNESFSFLISNSNLLETSLNFSPVPEKLELLWEWHHFGKTAELKKLATILLSNESELALQSVLNYFENNWRMELFCLFVNLLELLQFDSAIDTLSTAFSSKIMSFTDVFQARNTFGLKENDISEKEIDVAWGNESSKTLQDFSVSMIVDDKKLRESIDGSEGNGMIQFDVNPRTQLRLFAIPKLVDTKQQIKPLSSSSVSSQITDTSNIDTLPEEITKCAICNRLKQYSYFASLIYNEFEKCVLCGRTVCGDCFKLITVPLSFCKYQDPTGAGAKVCTKCLPTVKNEIPVYSRAFQIMGLTIEVLQRIATMSIDLRTSSIHSLSFLRELQYSLPRKKFERILIWENRSLWNNRNYFYLHDQWLLKLMFAVNFYDEEALRIINYEYSGSEKLYSCQFTMCTRKCSHFLKDTDHSLGHKVSFYYEDAICLLSSHVLDPRFRSYAVEAFKEVNDTELENFLPVLIHGLRYEKSSNSPTLKFLLSRCDSITIRQHLYWSLIIGASEGSVKTRNIYVACLIKFSAKVGTKYPEWIDSQEKAFEFVEVLKSIPNDNSKINGEVLQEIITQLKQFDGISIPYDSSLKVKTFDVKDQKIKIFNSKTRPLILKCEQVDITGKSCIRNLFFKRDDLRRDQVVMCLLSQLNVILRRHASELEEITQGRDVQLFTYRILPMDVTEDNLEYSNHKSEGKGYGMTEFVPDCESLQSIMENPEYSHSIDGYFLKAPDNDREISTKDLYLEYFHSTALYTVFTFLLGIGDRNKNNIMISSNGTFFHIDFEFLFGTEPGSKKIFMDGTPFRLTQEMIDVMKKAPSRCNLGPNKEAIIERFYELCKRYYQIFRTHYALFYYMIGFLVENGMDSSIDIEKHVQERFLPGHPNEIANSCFDALLRKGEGWMVFIPDYVHTITVNNVYQRFKDSLWSGVGNLATSSVSIATRAITSVTGGTPDKTRPQKETNFVNKNPTVVTNFK